MKRKLLTLLALALLAVPAASPFFLPDVPRTNDLPAHLFRTFFFIRAVEWGGLWPRWSPDLVYGHGYPVFNFFPSLFHWVLALIHKAGLPLLTAYRVHIYLLFLVTEVSSYLLGIKIFKSRAAGWAAALIYTYSPYLLYDSHVRGSGPELQALAFLPLLILLLWEISGETKDGLFPRNRFLAMVATAIVFAIILLSHPIAYQLLIPLGIWLMIRAIFAWRRGSLGTTLIPPMVGIGLGGLLTAFYWLPPYLEVNHTRASFSISQGYTYQTNFLSLLEMVRWPYLPADPALVNPPIVRALPVVGLFWAIAFIFLRWRRMNRTRRETVVAWGIVFILSVWLMTPYSVFVWDNFPLLRFTFYPWRLLGMASMAVAVLVATSAEWQVSSDGQKKTLWRVRGESLLLTILVIGAAIPWLYPPRTALTEEVDLSLALSDERPPFIIGTTTYGEFLPKWVAELPPQEPLRGELLANGNPDRLQNQDGLTWVQHTDNPIKATYTITASQPMTITYRQFYFPGWTAQVNGEDTPITPSDPHGLITIPVSAGQHDVDFVLRTTMAQKLGVFISIIAATVLIALALMAKKRESQITQLPDYPSPTYLLIMAVAALSVWLFFTVVDTPLRRPTLLPDGIVGKPSITPLDYAGELRLLSVEFPTAVSSDEPIPLTLYWQPQTQLGVSYKVGVRVVDENGILWGGNSGRPSDWRFIGHDIWPMGGYRMDPFIVEMMDGAPPGRYYFDVGLVRDDTNETVAAYQVGEFVIDEPATGADGVLEEGMTSSFVTAEKLQLLGHRLDRREAAPGDPIRVTTLWYVEGEDVETPVLQLVTDSGEILIKEPVALAADAKPNDRLRAENVISLPASLPDGIHKWQVLWSDQVVDLHEVQINAPERSFDVPEMETVLNFPFYTPDGNLFATLLGGAAPTSDLPLTLYWQAETETAVNYRVFVHLVDTNGNIIAQSDGEPANWTRPTTGWLPGEIVTDLHTLTMPDEAFELHIGLYDPGSGERLIGETAEYAVIPLN
jgi:hypothetical protein